MRTLILTPDKNTRVVIEISCDIDLLVACVKDGELDPSAIAKTMNESVAKIVAALHKGVAKKKALEAEQ